MTALAADVRSAAAAGAAAAAVMIGIYAGAVRLPLDLDVVVAAGMAAAAGPPELDTLVAGSGAATALPLAQATGHAERRDAADSASLAAAHCRQARQACRCSYKVRLPMRALVKHSQVW